jgi:hypothetical protein
MMTHPRGRRPRHPEAPAQRVHIRPLPGNATAAARYKGPRAAREIAPAMLVAGLVAAATLGEASIVEGGCDIPRFTVREFDFNPQLLWTRCANQVEYSDTLSYYARRTCLVATETHRCCFQNFFAAQNILQGATYCTTLTEAQCENGVNFQNIAFLSGDTWWCPPPDATNTALIAAAAATPIVILAAALAIT